MSGNWNTKIAVVLCTPLAKTTGPTGKLIFDPISPLWHRARMGLSLGTNINSVEICVDGLEVGDARSRVAARCLEMKPNPEYLFFLDSDVIVPADAFTKLFYRLKVHPEIDIAAGVYCVKGINPSDPLIYRELGEGAFWDWAVGDILTTRQHNIRAVHMGLCLIRVSLFSRMKEEGLVSDDGTNQEYEPFFCTQRYERESPTGGHERFAGTEDIYFCNKARNLEKPLQILVDTSVLAGHHDKSTGITYGLPGNTVPIEKAFWLPLPDGTGRRRDRALADANLVDCDRCIPVGPEHYDGNARLMAPPDGFVYRQHCLECKGDGRIKKPCKIAIDLGAGSERKDWPGYKVYTLDSRKESGCDYCQELPRLNLPNDNYDLVYSNHSFEHVGRWEQELLWSEVFRICKPGGRLDVTVPNIDWAAHKIVAGDMDTHVLNVLYGSQEADTEINDRLSNCHFFGYTREVLCQLAEKAGFVDIVVVDWRDDPEMAYHMNCVATKPDLVNVAPKEQNHAAGNGQHPGTDSDAGQNGSDNTGVLAETGPRVGDGVDQGSSGGQAKTGRQGADLPGDLL